MFPFFKVSNLAVGSPILLTSSYRRIVPREEMGALLKVDHLPHIGPLYKEPLVS